MSRMLATVLVALINPFIGLANTLMGLASRLSPGERKDAEPVDEELKRAALYRQMTKERMCKNLPPGSMVLVRSNEWDDPLRTAILLGYTDFGKDHNDNFPVVEFRDGDRETYVCFGIVKKYHKGKRAALEKLTPREQWNVLADNMHYEE